MPTEQTDVSQRPLTFVSHSSKDKLIADAICARLESQGIRCWIAPRDVDPGRDYSNQIADALERSAVMVMVVSSGSNTSRHVKSEIDRAFSLGQVIVPFRVENIELDKGLAYYLSKTLGSTRSVRPWSITSIIWRPQSGNFSIRILQRSHCQRLLCRHNQSLRR
jgi:hypothetical protein